LSRFNVQVQLLFRAPSAGIIDDDIEAATTRRDLSDQRTAGGVTSTSANSASPPAAGRRWRLRYGLKEKRISPDTVDKPIGP
jgi:hypothetical protein